MDVSIYKTVNYVDDDTSSSFYNPIDTTGAANGDFCLDLSQQDWYVFDGTKWVLTYTHILNPSSVQLIDVVYSTSNNIIVSKLSAQVTDLRYAISDKNILTTLSATLSFDRNAISHHRYTYEN